MDRKNTMKNNTKTAKINLEKALRAMPDDFALFDAKQHMRIALNKINEIEIKREKRQILKEKRKLKLDPNSISIIDKMIEQEKEKLETLNSEAFLEQGNKNE